MARGLQHMFTSDPETTGTTTNPAPTGEEAPLGSVVSGRQQEMDWGDPSQSHTCDQVLLRVQGNELCEAGSMHTPAPQPPVPPQKSLHTHPQAFDGVKGQNTLKTQHSVQAEGLHHDPNSSNCSVPLPWPEAGGKEGPSFMTWAFV